MHILLSEFNSFLTVLLLEKMLKYENKSISLWSPLPYILLQLIDLQELKSRGETEILITLGAIRVFKFHLPLREKNGRLGLESSILTPLSLPRLHLLHRLLLL